MDEQPLVQADSSVDVQPQSSFKRFLNFRFLSMAAVLLAIPLTVFTAMQRQDIRQRASELNYPDINRPGGFLIYPNDHSNVPTCTAAEGSVIGWARDTDKPDARINVDIHIDGRHVDTVVANRLWDSTVGEHGFQFDFPPSLRDGRVHTIQAFGRNINSNGIEISGPIPGTYDYNAQLKAIYNGTETSDRSVLVTCPIPPTATPTPIVPTATPTPITTLSIINPGFENDRTKWTTWDGGNGLFNEPHAFMPDTTEKHSGAKSMKVHPTGTVGCLNQGIKFYGDGDWPDVTNPAFETTSLFVNHPFNISTWYKTLPGTSVILKVNPRFTDGSRNSQWDPGVLNAPPSDSWTQINKNITIPTTIDGKTVNAIEVDLCYFSSAPGPTAWFDDIAVSDPVIPTSIPTSTPIPPTATSAPPTATPTTQSPAATSAPVTGDASGTNGVGIEDFNIWRDAFIAFTANSSNYDRRADMYPIGNPDGRINIFDFNVWRDAYLQSR